MSILSKIITVLLVVSVIAISVAVPMVQRDYLSWVDKYEQVKLDAEKWAKAYEGIQNVKDRAQTDFNEAVARLTEDNANLLKELENLRGSLQTRTMEVSKLEGQLAMETGAKSQVMALLTRAQNEAVSLRSMVSDSQGRITKLTVDYQQASEQLTKARAENEYLLKQVKLLMEELATRELAPPQTTSGVGPAQAAVVDSGLPIRGRITMTSGDLATINVGQVDGVRPGMKFAIYRGPNFLADLVISRVEEANAVGKLELIRQSVQKDDLVLNTLD